MKVFCIALLFQVLWQPLSGLRSQTDDSQDRDESSLSVDNAGASGVFFERSHGALLPLSDLTRPARTQPHMTPHAPIAMSHSLKSDSEQPSWDRHMVPVPQRQSQNLAVQVGVGVGAAATLAAGVSHGGFLASAPVVYGALARLGGIASRKSHGDQLTREYQINDAHLALQDAETTVFAAERFRTQASYLNTLAVMITSFLSLTPQGAAAKNAGFAAAYLNAGLAFVTARRSKQLIAIASQHLDEATRSLLSESAAKYELDALQEPPTGWRQHVPALQKTVVAFCAPAIAYALVSGAVVIKASVAATVAHGLAQFYHQQLENALLSFNNRMRRLHRELIVADRELLMIKDNRFGRISTNAMAETCGAMLDHFATTHPVLQGLSSVINSAAVAAGIVREAQNSQRAAAKGGELPPPSLLEMTTNFEDSLSAPQYPEAKELTDTLAALTAQNIRIQAQDVEEKLAKVHDQLTTETEQLLTESEDRLNALGLESLSEVVYTFKQTRSEFTKLVLKVGVLREEAKAVATSSLPPWSPELGQLAKLAQEAEQHPELHPSHLSLLVLLAPDVQAPQDLSVLNDAALLYPEHSHEEDSYEGFWSSDSA